MIRTAFLAAGDSALKSAQEAATAGGTIENMVVEEKAETLTG